MTRFIGGRGPPCTKNLAKYRWTIHFPSLFFFHLFFRRCRNCRFFRELPVNRQTEHGFRGKSTTSFINLRCFLLSWLPSRKGWFFLIIIPNSPPLGLDEVLSWFFLFMACWLKLTFAGAPIPRHPSSDSRLMRLKGCPSSPSKRKTN